MKINKIIIVVVLLLVGMLVVSCSSKDEDGKKQAKAAPDSVELSCVPDWFLLPPTAEEVVYGVGSAKLKKLDASRTSSLARARTDIAFQLSAQVEAALTDYYQESGTDNNTQALQFLESISRQVADTELRGTKTEQMEACDDGTIYALVSYPLANAVETVATTFARNEDAAFAEFKAQEALKALDARLANNPTIAGQSNQ